MRDGSLALGEPLLQEASPCIVRCGGKVLTLLSLILGLSSTVLLSLVAWTSGDSVQESQDASAQKGAITMPARAQHSMQPARAAHFSQPARAQQFMQPARIEAMAWQPMQSLGVWQSTQPIRDTIVRADDDDFDDLFGDMDMEGFKKKARQEYAEENKDMVVQMPTPKGATDSEGSDNTGTIARWNIERGFGFIRKDSGGDDLFCHVRDIVGLAEGTWPRAGEAVSFRVEFNDKKQSYQAKDVLLASSGAPAGEVGGVASDSDQMDSGATGNNMDTGTIKVWNYERGFGFIEPVGGQRGNDIFCHFSKLVDGPESVQEGDQVTFQKQISQRTGKWEAIDVRVMRQEDGYQEGEEAEAEGEGAEDQPAEEPASAKAEEPVGL